MPDSFSHGIDDAMVSGPEHLVQPARLAQFESGGHEPDGSVRSIDFLFDVSLTVSVELGRTEMAIRDILALNTGSVVELNRLAGEPVDILVNGKAIARGEVVVIDDMFGVRVVDILSPHDRITSLK